MRKKLCVVSSLSKWTEETERVITPQLENSGLIPSDWSWPGGSFDESGAQEKEALCLIAL